MEFSEVGERPQVKALPVQAERRFFLWLAALIATFVLVGFSRTYYLHSLFGQPRPSRFLHFHGAVMTGWIALFFVQTLLVSSGRISLHRKLGALGAGYAALVLVLGSTATVMSARREVRAHSQFASSFLTVLALELTQMLMFASLVALAIWLRRSTDYHKRLMLLATLCMLPNPIVRLALLVGINQNIQILAIWALLVVAVAATDTLRRRELHPVFGVAGVSVIGLLYCAYFMSRTDLWQQFAARMVA
jgi:hypothetical protein